MSPEKEIRRVASWLVTCDDAQKARFVNAILGEARAYEVWKIRQSRVPEQLELEAVRAALLGVRDRLARLLVSLPESADAALTSEVRNTIAAANAALGGAEPEGVSAQWTIKLARPGHSFAAIGRVAAPSAAAAIERAREEFGLREDALVDASFAQPAVTQ